MTDMRTPSAAPITRTAPPVAIVMGSKNDWPIMAEAAKVLEEFGVAYEARVVSAHRTPQLPKGVPVLTLAIGAAGAANAGLSAIAILALNNPQLSEKLRHYRAEQTQSVLAQGALTLEALAP